MLPLVMVTVTVTVVRVPLLKGWVSMLGCGQAKVASRDATS